MSWARQALEDGRLLLEYGLTDGKNDAERLLDWVRSFEEGAAAVDRECCRDELRMDHTRRRRRGWETYRGEGWLP